ncbi:hypothetical protein ES703_123954 [subsurface metagenome]
MVAPEPHYRIISKALVFELFEDFADLLVHQGNNIVILRPVSANRRRIRIIRRQHRFRRVMPLIRIETRQTLEHTFTSVAYLTFV